MERKNRKSGSTILYLTLTSVQQGTRRKSTSGTGNCQCKNALFIEIIAHLVFDKFAATSARRLMFGPPINNSGYAPEPDVCFCTICCAVLLDQNMDAL